jgi:hypothetical protein
MLKLAHALIFTVAMVAGAGSANAVPQEFADSAAQAQGVSTPRKKKLGDVSYRTMWRLQKRVAAMLPKNARLISPILRLSVAGMGEFERTEFQPDTWAVAIVGKTIDALVPMRRGGYFELPALPQAQARHEDAIVMFNSASRKNWFDVGWTITIPSSGTLAYTQFGQALAELKQAQSDMPWWDIMVISEKNARFNALRACFSSDKGKILVAGAPAGTKLGTHCTLLAFDPEQVSANPAIDFVGGLDFVTLDNSANYAVEAGGAH